MFRKLTLAAVAAAGVMMAAGGTAEAGCHRGGFGYGPRFSGYYGRPYGYGYRGVVMAPRVVPAPVYAYPVYPNYGYPYGGYPYGVYGGYGPYGQAFGLQTGNFSLFLGR